MDITSYLGIPFVGGGRTRESGLDCWGLVRLVYLEQLGLDLREYAGVTPEDPVWTSIAEEEATASWLEVPHGDRREGDVVILRVLGLPWHVGVMVDQRAFVHTVKNIGVCIERIDSVHWKNRVLGYRRLKDTELAGS